MTLKRGQPLGAHGLGLVAPPGLHATNLTTAQVTLSGTAYGLYLCKLNYPITTIDLVCNVTTAAGTITWAEVAIYKGLPVANGNAGTLTRAGSTNVAATFNTGGRKKTTVALSGLLPGDDLWVVYGAQATTALQLRGMLADDLQSGVYQTASGQPSANATLSFTLAGATVVPAWWMAKL